MKREVEGKSGGNLLDYAKKEVQLPDIEKKKKEQ